MSTFALPTNVTDLYRLCWADGGSKPATIVFHEDGGHGWLQVRRELLTLLDLTTKISRFSYQDINFVYLEEDLDFSLFVVALGLPENNLMSEFWQVCDREQSEWSHIRNMQQYHPVTTRAQVVKQYSLF